MVFKWRDNYTDEFLNLYRSYEYLWNNLNPLYKNRVAREAAYKEIIQTLKQPNLTVRDVKNKIKTIRTNYKYELNKVLRSEKDAVHPSDVYVPHLFWFKKADEFLRDFSMGREFNNSKMEYSEDETSCMQSEDNTHFHPEHEEFDIKLEEQSLQEDEISLEGINSENHSRSPSPPAAKLPRSDEETPIYKTNSTNSENRLKSNVTIPKSSLPSSSKDSENKVLSSLEFKTPASVHKANGRQFRKYSTINLNPKPRMEPIYRTRQFFQLEERISSLQRSVDALKNDEDDEFDLFGKSIALQLKKMPLERAFICQENLQRIINQERLNQNRLSMNGFAS